MKVSIVNYMHDPIGTISYAAGACYGKRDRKPSRVKNCAERGHWGVFEHAVIMFELEDVSRNLTHQLVRHRLCSFNEMSLRYVKLDGTQEYVVPPSILANEEILNDYYNVLDEADIFYRKAIAAGIPAEDARYAIPGAIETRIIVTVNSRELFHFLDLRTDDRAQWEIREAAWKMVEEMRENDDLRPLVEIWEDDQRQLG